MQTRKGEELKAPHYASAAVLRDDHVTIRDIVPIIIEVEDKLALETKILVVINTLLDTVSIAL
jgi:hypothetical protein